MGAGGGQWAQLRGYGLSKETERNDELKLGMCTKCVHYCLRVWICRPKYLHGMTVYACVCRVLLLKVDCSLW